MTRTDIRLPRLAFRSGARILLLGVAALATGCASAQAPAAPAGQSPSASPQQSPARQSPPASTRSSPAASTRPGPAAGVRAQAARYLAIARPANHRLDVAVESFGDNRRHNLAKAVAALRSEASTERRFDRQLARIRFPAAITAIARALILANRSRIRLTRREAQSASLAELRSFTSRHKAADAAVEIPVKAIRKALGLPPPSNS
ncbi:MAG TPA: hypothetical protein VK162_22520 [Streptosporangiaceae bacterium]|nr:hypothetical protein [Streptosporangiaceae bacterium]